MKKLIMAFEKFGVPYNELTCTLSKINIIVVKLGGKKLKKKI